MGQATYDIRILQSEVMRLWETYATKYRNIIPEYNDALAYAREIGVRPLRRLNQDVFDEYIEIPFFEITDYDDARRSIEDLTIDNLQEIIYNIYTRTNGYAYKTISSRISDLKAKIRRIESKRTPFAIDPSYPIQCKR